MLQIVELGPAKQCRIGKKKHGGLIFPGNDCKTALDVCLLYFILWALAVLAHRNNVATTATIRKIEADAVVEQIGRGSFNLTDRVSLGKDNLVNNNGRPLTETFLKLNKGGYLYRLSG